MINVWFISDTHFGHKNILEYEKEARPFSTIEEMHEAMIERWNRVVKEKDIVYHLGDFAFGRDNIKIASKLNGNKRLIMGNHDVYPATDYLLYFTKLAGVLFYKKCILSHIPVHINNLGKRCILNIHGHLHSKEVVNFSWKQWDYFPNQKVMTIEKDINYFNVSCEQNNLTPIHWDLIKERIEKL